MKHLLPSLSYDYAALEKYPDLQERTAPWLRHNLDKVPEAVRAAVRNNAGGHVNHCHYWRAMSPTGGGYPRGMLAQAIERDFDSFETFRARFVEAGAKVVGSGWVWLAKARQDGGKLVVLATTGHDSPLVQDYFPILVNDVWEHAFYFKYQNRRPEFLDGWWSVANWHEAGCRFEREDHGAEQEWEEEGGKMLAAQV